MGQVSWGYQVIQEVKVHLEPTAERDPREVLGQGVQRGRRAESSPAPHMCLPLQDHQDHLVVQGGLESPVWREDLVCWGHRVGREILDFQDHWAGPGPPDPMEMEARRGDQGWAELLERWVSPVQSATRVLLVQLVA